MNRPMAGMGWMTALALTASLAQAAPLALTTHLELGATSSAFWDVNNSGTVVGYSLIGGNSRAFTWTAAGGFVPLALPDGAAGAVASGISDTGLIVGSWSKPAGTDPGTGNPLFENRGYLYDGVGFTNYEISGATNTWLRAVSPDGRYITGYYDNTATGVLGQGFVQDLSTGALQFIGAGGNDLTIAQGVSNGGVVVGSDRIFDDVSGSMLARPAFVFDSVSSSRVDHNLPGAGSSAFRAIDSGGTIAGWVIDGAGVQSGFTGFPGPLTSIAWGAPDTGTYVEGSNDAGWLVGAVINDLDGSQRALLAMPVPEPSTWALLLFGLAAVGGLARRTR